MKDHRTTPDDLADLPDRAVGTGITNLRGSQVNMGDLNRGHRKVSNPYEPEGWPMAPRNPEPQSSPATDRGFLSRPDGFER